MARHRAPSVLVVGSLNMDLAVRVTCLPSPGETVAGDALSQACGGKGANQAVAAARFGARVSMVGRVGQDDFGRQLLANLRRERVATRSVARSAGSSGVALIMVDERGENLIAVAPGANAELSPADVPPATVDAVDSVVAQLEVPLEAVAAAFRLARERHRLTVLNAAPALPGARDILHLTDVLVVNEHELAALLGEESIVPGQELAAAGHLADGPEQIVVVTLGERGAVARRGSATFVQPSWPVNAVDSTAAGDAFVGAFVASFRDAASLPVTLRNACAAGALATTRPGAQPSLPTRAEVEAYALSPSASASRIALPRTETTS